MSNKIVVVVLGLLTAILATVFLFLVIKQRNINTALPAPEQLNRSYGESPIPVNKVDKTVEKRMGSVTLEGKIVCFFALEDDPSCTLGLESGDSKYILAVGQGIELSEGANVRVTGDLIKYKEDEVVSLRVLKEKDIQKLN